MADEERATDSMRGRPRTETGWGGAVRSPLELLRCRRKQIAGGARVHRSKSPQHRAHRATERRGRGKEDEGEMKRKRRDSRFSSTEKVDPPNQKRQKRR